MKLAQLKFPGQNNTSVDAPAPAGIPEGLKGGLSTSGASLFQLTIDWVFYIGIILAVAFMLISGISWITSGGETQKVAKAKARFTYSLIGLVIIISAFFIVRLVISSLGGDPSKFFNFGR